jgi:hypothetical protein
LGHDKKSPTASSLKTSIPSHKNLKDVRYQRRGFDGFSMHLGMKRRIDIKVVLQLRGTDVSLAVSLFGSGPSRTLLLYLVIGHSRG